ncbi:hypothetical protein PIB30_029225 [Stylosanthes scabra]|uniref:Pentatricopeptide repeat-containing protein n=1 Tax=Stylosanthes scabra TaxID=79078 RepID=A0ABU6RBI0_9FABA|nr:hypothetical protein [Stylosanthes scabra]
MHGVSRRVQQFLVPKPHHKDSFYYTNLLSLCKTTNCIEKTHAQIVVHGHEQNPFITTKLVDRYTQLSSNLEHARKVFDNLSERDVFCWNVLIKGYANMGPFVQAIKVYDEMRTSGTTPNRYTYPFALKACAAERDSHKGIVIHGHVVKCGLDLDLFVANALIAFYAKCQDVEVSRRVFDEMPQRDIVSWNSMISGYAMNGYVDDAILLFYDMLRDVDISAPDKPTFVTILPAFAQAADIQAGYWIHSYIVKIGMNLDAAIAKEALNMFQQLVESNVKPDSVLFLCLLSACSHAGLLEQGWHVFQTMESYGVEKNEAHYACIVDLLGRAGDLDKALEIIQTMPIQPGKNVYGALLGASRIHKNMELAEFAAEKLLVLDPNNAGRYVILAQMYEHAGRWEDAARVRKVIKEKEIKKPIGYSSVELESGHQKFGVNDETHPFTTQIFETLLSLDKIMGKEASIHWDSILVENSVC